MTMIYCTATAYKDDKMIEKIKTIGMKKVYQNRGDVEALEKATLDSLSEKIKNREIDVPRNVKGEPLICCMFTSSVVLGWLEIAAGLAKTKHYAGQGRKVKRRKFPFAGTCGVVTLKLNKRGA